MYLIITEEKKDFQHQAVLYKSNIFNTLKVLSATFLLVYFLSPNKSTCQTRKKNFFFTSKALFVFGKSVNEIWPVYVI